MRALLFSALLLTLFSCSKDPVQVQQETPVNKTIAFAVFTSKDYNDAFYDNAFAEVRLSIGKINLKNNTTEIIWDTTYNFRQFKQYPKLDQKIHLEKVVSHFENAEVLQTSTVVRYNFNGNLSMEAKGDPVQRYERYKLMTVSF
jgi:hypothetical protein